MIAFAYYGAKNGMLPQLLPLLPITDHYVEPFAGSAAVLMNRRPANIETLNDLNGDIVNFFRVLRDHTSQLVKSLELTPYAYQEFYQAWEPSDCPVESARRFYIRTQMDVAKAGHKKDRSWSVNKKFIPGSHSSAANNFHSKVDGFYAIANRLKYVQIDGRDALDCIKKFDSKDTLFYCDPPYLPATRTSSNDYKFELKQDGHIELSKVLNSIKGKAAVSGYDHPLYNELFKGWIKIEFKSKQVPMSRGKGRVRQEVLWLNYDPPTGIQKTIFDDQKTNTNEHRT